MSILRRARHTGSPRRFTMHTGHWGLARFDFEGLRPATKDTKRRQVRRTAQICRSRSVCHHMRTYSKGPKPDGFAGALATTQAGRLGGPSRSRAGGPKSRKGRSRLFGSTLPVPVRTAAFGRGSPRQDVSNGICNKSRSSSAPLPESEHHGKEKSCQSSK
jgi:hypothetical protein